MSTRLFYENREISNNFKACRIQNLKNNQEEQLSLKNLYDDSEWFWYKYDKCIEVTSESKFRKAQNIGS